MITLSTADHLSRTIAAIILKLVYGYDVSAGKDPLVELVDTAMEQFSISSTPGAFLVDVFPLLRYVPEWFPGAGWKKNVAPWKSKLTEMTDVPFNFVTARMVS